MTTLLAETYQDTPDRNGVRVVDGYGVRIAIERGHLVIADGTGRHRRQTRYPKVAHGLRRLVVIGHTGTISLEAIRWLDRLGIALVNIDNDGRELARTSRAGLDDARLRRSQAIATGTPTGLGIVIDLLDAKLAGQATIATTHLHAPHLTDHIDQLRQRLSQAETLEEARDCEAKAAQTYFAAWPDHVAIRWANRDHNKVPEHWHRFDARRSPLSAGSPVRAGDPVNALLNYLYALAETECRHACQTLGLDPGLGFLHADRRGRDSLALDLIEALRPAIDAYLLDLLDGHVFRRSDFHETDDGHCRLLAPLTHRLAETLPQWHAAVAPWAEAVTHTLADASPHPVRKGTPLTSATRRSNATQAAQSRRREPPRPRTAPKTKRTTPPGCEDCGQPLTSHPRRYCATCWAPRRQDALCTATNAATAAITDPASRARKGAAISTGRTAGTARAAIAHGWQPDDWQQLFAANVTSLTLAQIRDATGLSISYASRLKRAVQTPHPRHWAAIESALQQWS